MIDAHVHFWDGPLDWMAGGYEALGRPFGPERLRPLADACGVDRVIAVQASPSLDETRRLLSLVGDFVAGVVGWVDLTAPDVADTIASLGPGLVGIRHQVHDEPDPLWLLRDDVRRGLHAVADAGLAYDLLVRPRELRAALALARDVHDVRFVIDHLAKPPIAAGGLEPWAERLAPFAALDHVSCKVSGLVTEASWERWAPADLAPYLERAVEWFGEDRLLFGSDWPVCTLAASYEDVVRAYDAPRFAAAERVYAL